MKTNKDVSDTREMAIKDLKLNEVIHDSLSDKQLKEIERIHKVFSEVLSSSLEETITNFKRDSNPDNEIAVWLKMAEAYEKFTLKGNAQIDTSKKVETFEVILLRSMMGEEEVTKKIKLQYLTNEDVKEIFSYYTDPPRLLEIK